MRRFQLLDDNRHLQRPKTRRGKRVISWPQARPERERPNRKERRRNRQVKGGRQ